MKQIMYLIIVFYGWCIMACTDNILQKPFGSDLLVDSIFSSEQKAMGAIAQAYSNSLIAGITLMDWDNDRKYGLRAGTLSHISGELNALKYNWEDGWLISHNGMTADDGSGKPRSDDSFGFNYTAIRHNYLVIENIDKVADMTEEEKQEVKAEMKALTAYRYEEMFKRYGGVPIVTKSLNTSDEIQIPRASLEEVLDHIVTLCDEAATGLPDSYPDKFKGRVTKGVALAIKAEALLFAARPLFNNSTPYMSLGGHEELICFGEENPERWQDVIVAAEAVLGWARENGCYLIHTGSPLDDYGTACATPSNPEVLLAYKSQYASGNNGNYYDPHGESGGANGMSYYQLTRYVKADGTEQTWPETETRPYAEYQEKIEEMEPRYKASAMGAGIDAWNNPNSEYWSSRVVTDGSTWEGRSGTEACGRRVKFWYHAGTRNWFEFPIYRLAEFYLYLAEAYNEVGNSAKALENLNLIRSRAGLPPVTDRNKEVLRKKIQREWAVEFYEEGHSLYDVKHWKLENIDKEIIGGQRKSFIFTYVNGDYAFEPSGYVTYGVKDVYTAFWSVNQYLSPFPVKEVNIGYLVQNPGY